jgi:hypothetical protein
MLKRSSLVANHAFNTFAPGTGAGASAMMSFLKQLVDVGGSPSEKALSMMAVRTGATEEDIVSACKEIAIYVRDVWIEKFGHDPEVREYFEWFQDAASNRALGTPWPEPKIDAATIRAIMRRLASQSQHR